MAASIQPGTLLGGDFRIERELGAGGFGTAFQATQISTGRARAVKVLHASLEMDADSRRLFLEEARIGGRVKSGHIVEVVASGFDEAARAPWLAMELLDGENMQERVRKGGPIAVRDARKLFEQLAHGLGAAHDQGIVHRDLKPENIFLCRPRHHGDAMMVKILDFGIAKSLDDGRTAGTATAAIGSPLFMAPEQGTEGAAIRRATDVWPLGLIAFFALTGLDYWKAAHGSRNLRAMFTEVLVEPIEPATERARRLGSAIALPPDFDVWFASCLERDPERRFRDARACLRALDAVLEGAVLEGAVLAGAGRAPAAYAATVAAPVTPPPATPAPVAPISTPAAGFGLRGPVAPTAPMAPGAAPLASTAPLDRASPTHVVLPRPAPSPTPRSFRDSITGPTMLVVLMAFLGAGALAVTLFGDQLTEESSVEATDAEPVAVEPVVPATSPAPPEPTPAAPTPVPQPQPVPRQPAVDLGLPTPESATATPDWQMHTRIYEFPAARHERQVVPIRFRLRDGARAEIFVNGRSRGDAPVDVRMGPGLHLIGQVDESGTANYGWVVFRAFGPWQEWPVEPLSEHNFIHPLPGRSHLFLQTDLPLRVSVDGGVVDFEATPFMDVAPGTHIMVMRNTETDREERLEVRCAANRTTSVRRSHQNLDVYLREL